MKRVFLIGAARSGTTLLQSRLVAAGEIASLPETAYFNALFGLSRQRTFSIGEISLGDRYKQYIRRQWGIGGRSRRAYALLKLTAERANLELDGSLRPGLLARQAVGDFTRAQQTVGSPTLLYNCPLARGKLMPTAPFLETTSAKI